MGLSLRLAVRYLSNRRGDTVSLGSLLAVLGVTLSVTALIVVLGVTGGFLATFQEKVLGVNAHVLVMKYTSDFREYREVMGTMEKVPGIAAVAPFRINPMMVTHGGHTATGVLLKGIDPERTPQVLDLPRHIEEGSMAGLRQAGAAAPQRRETIYSRDWEDTAEVPRIPTKGDPEAQKRDEALALKTAQLIDENRARQLLPAGAVASAGYESALPEDDVLEDVLPPDPCEDEAARAKLPGIIIGRTLKENLGVKLGDCVQVTSPTIGFTFSEDTIRAPVRKSFRVSGIFFAGFEQYDSKFVYTDLYEAQSFWDTGDSVTGVEARVTDVNRAREIKDRLAAELSGRLYQFVDWEELNHGLFTALRIQQRFGAIVLGIMIIVASFTVIATLIMIVLQKRKEIAVLMAMGASSAVILRTFLYQGLMIGAVGTSLGLIGGASLCHGIIAWALPLDPKVYFISHVPIQSLPWHYGLVGGFSFLVCLAAAFVPALHAANLVPTQAFRD